MDIQNQIMSRNILIDLYGGLLHLNEDFRSGVTGLFLETDNNEFILKLYDIDNDPNLYFLSY